MNRLLSASLLALGAMTATSAFAVGNADYYPGTKAPSTGTPYVTGGHLYIQDSSKAVNFYAGFFDYWYGDGMKFYDVGWTTTKNIEVYIATIDADGNIVDNWQYLLRTNVDHTISAGQVKLTPNAAFLDLSHGYYTYKPSAGANEIILRWENPNPLGWDTYYSNKPGYNNTPTFTASYDNQLRKSDPTLWTSVGLEDYTYKFNDSVDRHDYDDILLMFSNVSGTPRGGVPAIPEPETYAMLLVGLGIVGAVARRRRTA